MGAGTSPADPASAGRSAEAGPASAAAGPASASAGPAVGGPDSVAAGPAVGGPDSVAAGGAPAARDAEPGEAAAGRGEPGSGPAEGVSADGLRAGEPGGGSTGTAPDGEAPVPRRSRRFPLFTRDTARPEGGGRAASGDAPAPARQWPLLTVLCAAGAGLLVVALDPFAEAFRIGTILIGAALIAGAVLRWVVPLVGMLAVRSRFTDLVTYGLMGTLIVLLALVAQPEPWLDVPILEDAVRFTIR
ncbi:MULTISPECIES: DUF3017 domain-containing protein [unclassified Streptomyces]|uniref:DUF3017 domain-containing protein n=1 Tax=unclassified Streptomyces TaxID=2593676 RepID=UPI00344CBEB1